MFRWLRNRSTANGWRRSASAITAKAFLKSRLQKFSVLSIESRTHAIARRAAQDWACRSPRAQCVCIEEQSKLRTQKKEGWWWKLSCRFLGKAMNLWISIKTSVKAHDSI